MKIVALRGGGQTVGFVSAVNHQTRDVAICALLTDAKDYSKFSQAQIEQEIAKLNQYSMERMYGLVFVADYSGFYRYY